MTALLGWWAANMIWASAAMLLVLALRRPVARWIGAGAAYALWLVPAVRLVLPPAEWLASLFPHSLPSLPPLVLFVDAGGGAPLPLSGSGQWMPILLAVWAGGALLFLGVQAAAYRRFLRGLSCQEVGAWRGVPLLESASVDGPLAMGVARRRIVVPADFDTRYAPAERVLALAHERHHHARGDILANHLALLVLALNWFNPVAWFAFRAFRADQELSCDAAVAAVADPETRRDYAHALVKSASRPGLIAACPLYHADQLKRRLKMLSHHRTGRARMLAGAGLTATLIAASIAFAGPSLAQDQPAPKQERQTFVIMEHRDGAAPASGNARFRIRTNRQGQIEDIAGADLPPEAAARLDRCRAGGSLLNYDSRDAQPQAGGETQRTRIILCGDGSENGAPSVEALQRARERLAARTELSAEMKQRVLAQIDEAIARARSGQGTRGN